MAGFQHHGQMSAKLSSSGREDFQHLGQRHVHTQLRTLQIAGKLLSTSPLIYSYPLLPTYSSFFFLKGLGQLKPIWRNAERHFGQATGPSQC